MPVTERLMLPGSWSLALRRDTPKAIRDALLFYGHLFILDDQVDNRKMTDAAMKAAARYVGILRRRKTVWDLEGPGLVAWLGNEIGVGDVFETAVTNTDTRFSAWITSLLPPGGSVVAGAISDPVQLLTNPGFEAAGTWVAVNTGTGTTALGDTLSSHTGTNNLKLTNPTAGNYGSAYNSVGIPVAGCTKLRVWWWGKAGVAGNSGPMRVTFANIGANVNALGIATGAPSSQAAVSIVDTTSTLTVNYTQFNAIITVPAGYTWAFIEIYGATGAGTVTPTYYDDLVVEPLLTQSFGGTTTPVTPRAAIDWIIANFANFSLAYRINPDGTLDAGPISALFKATPTAVAVAHHGPRDIGLVGIAASALEADRDVDEYASRILYLAVTGVAVAAGADTTFKDLRGNVAKLTKVISNPLTPAAMAGSAAAAAAATWVKQPRTQLVINSEEFDIGRDIEPGDNIYVFDQARGVYDIANQVRYQGRVILPQIWQVLSITWPVERGLGVYYRPGTATGGADYTDLTNYVIWEQPGATLEVGALTRRLV